MPWLDLLTEGDPHPRRFDGPQSLRDYLTRIERLDEGSVDTLRVEGRLEPPQSRQGLRLRPLTVAAHDRHG